MFESVQPGDSVLLVWSDLGTSPDMFQAAVTSVKETAGEFRVILSLHPQSTNQRPTRHNSL